VRFVTEFVELYAKILIGTFSFIGPSFTLLLSIFYAALLRSKQEHIEKLKNLSSIADSPDDRNLVDEMRRKGMLLQDLLKQNDKELRLLNPRRQVKRLFSGLLMAIVFVFIYYWQAADSWWVKKQWLIWTTLMASLLFYSYCIAVLWQIFCTIVRAKQAGVGPKQNDEINSKF
jgi:hypothetical protein